MPFNDRGRIYILGYAGVVLATILAVIGLGAPGWLSYSVPDVQVWFGLWERCMQGSGERYCEIYDYSDLDGYWKATQAMVCIAVALLVVCTLYGLCVNTLSTNLPSSPYLEIIAFLGGLFLFIGSMVCVGYKSQRMPPAISLSYAMILATIGSIMAFLASFCLSVGSRRSASYQVLP